MKLSSYLSLSRHGIFYFRWPLPRTDVDYRPTIRISLRTRWPDRAGTIARHLASCGQITNDNKELAPLRQNKLRELVRAFFQAQLDQYLEWINNRGLSPNALEDSRSEMLDHQDHLDSQRVTDMYLPIERFKRKVDVSDGDWVDSLPNAQTELRKGRRDVLQRALEATEQLKHYSPGREPVSAPLPSAPLSAPCGHSRRWRCSFSPGKAVGHRTGRPRGPGSQVGSAPRGLALDACWPSPLPVFGCRRHQ